MRLWDLMGSDGLEDETTVNRNKGIFSRPFLNPCYMLTLGYGFLQACRIVEVIRHVSRKICIMERSMYLRRVL